MDWKELSSRGGKARYKNQSHERLSEIGKKGAAGLKEKYGPDYFKNLAKKGLEARKNKKLAAGEVTSKTST